MRNSLVTLCSLLVGLAGLEGVALATRPATMPEGPIFNDSGLSRPRDVLGWGPTKPGVFRVSRTQPNGHVIFDTSVTIDENLNRKAVPSSGTRSIVFFGDSWIYGDGLKDSETLPQAFADLTKGKIPVLNLAMAGWSPAQNLADLSMRLFKPPLVSPRHFILFTAAFHLERTACKGNYAFSPSPRYVLDGDTVKYAGSCVGRGGNFLMTVSHLFQRFELYERIAPYFNVPTKHDVETYVRIISSFVDLAKRDYGVQTTVLFAPLENPYLVSTGYTETEIMEKLRKAGIDVLADKLPRIADDDLYWIPIDRHPSALSNKARAEEVRDHLQKVDPASLEVSDRAAQ